MARGLNCRGTKLVCPICRASQEPQQADMLARLSAASMAAGGADGWARSPIITGGRCGSLTTSAPFASKR